MRYMGLDYGALTVGVAVSDTTALIATGVETIRRSRESALRKTFARIRELCDTMQIDAVVLGLPLNMNGTSGERAEKTVAFKEELERKLALPVFLQDERLTSVEAEDIMKQNGIRPDAYKTYVDMIAAEVILQDFLNERRGN